MPQACMQGRVRAWNETSPTTQLAGFVGRPGRFRAGARSGRPGRPPADPRRPGRPLGQVFIESEVRKTESAARTGSARGVRIQCQIHTLSYERAVADHFPQICCTLHFPPSGDLQHPTPAAHFTPSQSARTCLRHSNNMKHVVLHHNMHTDTRL